MDHLDGFLRGEAGHNEFAAAGEPQHQVLFDETESDVEVGIYEAVIDIHGRSAPRLTNEAVLLTGSCIVTHDVIVGCDLRADDDVDFFTRGGAMQAGCNEDKDVLCVDS